MSDEPAAAGSGGWSALSSLDLDDLLTELRARAASARQSQERLGSLLDAVVAVSSDLDLTTVLQRIVASACQLVDARYGALGVLAPDGNHLSEFITHGISPEQRAEIGDLPRGRGVLGLLIRKPAPIRMRRIADHHDSVGFPPHHPPMGSFLGTPIRIRDQVFGNLYLAEKQGHEEFTGDDEAILIALAAAAGVAIENARLYERTERQRQWTEAVASINQALLEGTEEEHALSLMTERAGDLTQADLVVVALMRGDRLIVEAVNGPRRDACLGMALDDPAWKGLLRGDRAVVTNSGDAAAGELSAAAAALRISGGLDEPGSSALMPIRVGESAIGVIVAGWPAGLESSAVDAVPALEWFAQQCGLGLAASGAQRDRGRMERLEDRDRIARDMHDHVIQRLFATGLSLQSAGRLIDHPTVSERLDTAVDEIDLAIKDIRQAIFELHRPMGDRDARRALNDLIAKATASWARPPAATLHGDPDTLPEEVFADLIAVVREGLTNVAKHARATQVSLDIDIGERVLVRLTDDGVGVGRTDRMSGLANLTRRATSRGGQLEIGPGPQGGTVLTWQVPRTLGGP